MAEEFRDEQLEDKDYDIGYGKPPKHTRFKPGQSGNPRGRPKKTKDIDKLFDQELNRTLRIQEDGQLRTLTKREVIVKGVINAAMKGDHRAQKLAIGFMSDGGFDDLEVESSDLEALEAFLDQRKHSQGVDSHGRDRTGD